MFRLTALLFTFAFIGPAAWAGDSLYVRLGAEEGIARIVEDFTSLSLEHPRIAPTFEETNIPRFKEKLAKQLCEISGGPRVYDGLDMKQSHEPLDLDEADFIAIVEVLQEAMDRNDIPFRTQNRLLRLLAPMKPDVVSQ
jgi:hemoglobin